MLLILGMVLTYPIVGREDTVSRIMFCSRYLVDVGSQLCHSGYAYLTWIQLRFGSLVLKQVCRDNVMQQYERRFGYPAHFFVTITTRETWIFVLSAIALSSCMVDYPIFGA